MAKLVASVIVMGTAAGWAILPRFANAGRDAMQMPGPSAAAPELQKRGPESVPQTLSVFGRVVNPEGQPVPGARLYFDGDASERLLREPVAPVVRAITDPDGRFRFSIERSELASAPSRQRVPGSILAAFAQGYGPAWTHDPIVGDPEGALLELVGDDRPITGRLIDLEGRPLPDVELRVIQVDATPENDLSAWVGALQKKPNGYQSFNHFSKSLPMGMATLISPVKTRSDGRFQLNGAGRERFVSILVQGPRIETGVLQVMTRSGPSSSVQFTRPRIGKATLETLVIHAVGFEFVAAPMRTVEGKVSDAATGVPLPGVIIGPSMKYGDAFHRHYPMIDWPGLSIRTTTDVHGHYRLTGLPARQPIELRAEPAEGMSYAPCSLQVADTPGNVPSRCDFKLDRAVLIHGKVVDGATGAPVVALVEYRPSFDNVNIRSVDQIDLFKPVRTRPDGSFTVVGVPGPGVVAATAMGDRFLTADRSKGGKLGTVRRVPSVQGSISPQQRHAFELISLEKVAKSYECDLTLTPGPEPLVTILDGKGEPLAGALIGGAPTSDLVREGWWQSRQQSQFRVTDVTGHRIRRLSVHHEGKRLAGSIAIRDSEPGRIMAKLRPWGAVSGRLIDREGRPRAGVTLSYREAISGVSPNRTDLPRDTTSDAAGHFRLEGLVPGQEYVIKRAGPGQDGHSSRVGEPHIVESGEVKALGEVREADR